MKLDSGAVAVWLLDHPDFLERHPEVLAALQLTHPHGGHAVSLSERQLLQLRETNQQLERRMSAMLRYAEQNDRTGTRIHCLALRLLDCRTRGEVRAATLQELKQGFEVEQVGWREWADPARPLELAMVREAPVGTGAEEVEPDFVQCFEQLGQPYRGSEVPTAVRDWLEQVLPAHPPLHSCALLPLRTAHHTWGGLVLAASEESRFGPEMGTYYLSRIAELIACAYLARDP